MALPAEMLQQIKYDDFVVIDLETTGLDPIEDKIIEIGAIRFVNGEEKERFETLVNPGKAIPDFITKLTGIKDQDVQSSPKIDKVFDDAIAFIGNSPLVGHQINFDIFVPHNSGIGVYSKLAVDAVLAAHLQRYDIDA